MRRWVTRRRWTIRMATVCRTWWTWKWWSTPPLAGVVRCPINCRRSSRCSRRRDRLRRSRGTRSISVRSTTSRRRLTDSNMSAGIAGQAIGRPTHRIAHCSTTARRPTSAHSAERALRPWTSTATAKSSDGPRPRTVRRHAFLWTAGAMVDVNTFASAGDGVVLVRAVGIDDIGRILVHGSNGHAYIVAVDSEWDVAQASACRCPHSCGRSCGSLRRWYKVSHRHRPRRKDSMLGQASACGGLQPACASFAAARKKSD